MRKSIAAAEWKQFQRAAHTLKSGLRMFGVAGLAENVERLELAAKAGPLTGDTVETIQTVIERAGRVFSSMTPYLASSRK